MESLRVDEITKNKAKNFHKIIVEITSKMIDINDKYFRYQFDNTDMKAFVNYMKNIDGPIKNKSPVSDSFHMGIVYFQFKSFFILEQNDPLKF